MPKHRKPMRWIDRQAAQKAGAATILAGTVLALTALLSGRAGAANVGGVPTTQTTQRVAEDDAAWD